MRCAGAEARGERGHQDEDGKDASLGSRDTRSHLERAVVAVLEAGGLPSRLQDKIFLPCSFVVLSSCGSASSSFSLPLPVRRSVPSEQLRS